jgi:hypothetical protein
VPRVTHFEILSLHSHPPSLAQNDGGTLISGEPLPAVSHRRRRFEPLPPRSRGILVRVERIDEHHERASLALASGFEEKLTKLRPIQHMCSRTS